MKSLQSFIAVTCRYWSIGPKHYGIRTQWYAYLEVDERVELFDRLRAPNR